MLEIQNIKKTYGDFTLDCSMSIEEGCITGLIGANGAGKSTLFKTVLQLISPDEGNVKLLGKNYKDITAKDKENIGVVLSNCGFSGYLTIKRIIPVLDSMYQKFNCKKFVEACKRFDLPMDKMLKDFSTGMRAKFNLLVAMSYQAKLLILDEPTSGLDVLARGDLLDMLREYMEVDGRSILISSHISSDLEGLCDDLYMIHKGEIILHEDTNVLMDNYGVLKLTMKQFEKIGKKHLFYTYKVGYGYECLTKDRQFFADNYPDIVIEKGNVDEVLTIIEKGEKV